MQTQLVTNLLKMTFSDLFNPKICLKSDEILARAGEKKSKVSAKTFWTAELVQSYKWKWN